ncbi:MAG TPA: hypothetical protein VFZ18_16070, partial [Longimicrobiaceae bacterium]
PEKLLIPSAPCLPERSEEPALNEVKGSRWAPGPRGILRCAQDDTSGFQNDEGRFVVCGRFAAKPPRLWIAQHSGSGIAILGYDSMLPRLPITVPRPQAS